MIVNDDRKTTPKQRIIIFAIAVFLLGSTFALYAGIVLSYKNQETQQSEATAKQNRFNELYAEYQARENEQAKELSKKYFETFKKYRSSVKAFNAASANKELKIVDLVKGTGRTIDSKKDDQGNFSEVDTNYSAYYIGWLSDETIFDSSFDSNVAPTSLGLPLRGDSQMIQGWLEGIEGMKIGGVREITIPSLMAYGDQEQESIPAGSPLKFIVMLIEKQARPEASDELEKLANELYGYSFRSDD